VIILTNNGDKIQDLAAHVTVVDRKSLQITPGRHNAGYLRTKRVRMQHDLPADAGGGVLAGPAVSPPAAGDQPAGAGVRP
jgi:hypothetical protein